MVGKLKQKLNGANAEEKINSLIKEAEGKATARTISYADIVKTIEKLEKNLGCCKKDMVGVEVKINPRAQRFANAYKYTPEATIAYLTRDNNGWVLTKVERGICTVHTYDVLVMPEETKRGIIESRMLLIE